MCVCVCVYVYVCVCVRKLEKLEKGKIQRIRLFIDKNSVSMYLVGGCGRVSLLFIYIYIYIYIYKVSSSELYSNLKMKRKHK